MPAGPAWLGRPNGGTMHASTTAQAERMKFSLAAPTPLAYFEALVQSDAQFPLLEAAASLAQDEYPSLDVQQVLDEVDQLLDRIRRRIPADAPAAYKLRMLNQFFFRELHFRGNVNDYYDPDNSYLSVVLHSRRGIPISLAVLWLELAQGLGLAARGVGFPGHFMVKVNLPHGQVVIDPFTGHSLSREELSERLEPYRRRRALMEDSELPLGLFLQVSSARDIIARSDVVLENFRPGVMARLGLGYEAACELRPDIIYCSGKKV